MAKRVVQHYYYTVQYGYARLAANVQTENIGLQPRKEFSSLGETRDECTKDKAGCISANHASGTVPSTTVQYLASCNSGHCRVV